MGSQNGTNTLNVFEKKKKQLVKAVKEKVRKL